MFRLGVAFLAFLSTVVMVIGGGAILWYACSTLYPMIPQPYQGLLAVGAIIWGIVSAAAAFKEAD